MLSSLISDIVSAFTITEVEAESPPAVVQKEESSSDEEKEEAPEEEEEEAEAEEPEDIMPKLQEECANSKECKPYTHHYNECVERVTTAQDAGENVKEDCVEEFFHMMHCSAQCAAPKLFAQLK